MPQNMPPNMAGGLSRPPGHSGTGLGQPGATFITNPHYSTGYKSATPTPPNHGSPSPMAGLVGQSAMSAMPPVSGAPSQFFGYTLVPQTSNAYMPMSMFPAMADHMNTNNHQQNNAQRGRGGYGGRRQ